MRALRCVLALLLLCAVTLGGCGRGEDTAIRPSPAPSPTVSRPLDLSAFPKAPSGAVDEDTGETIRPEPVETWDAEARAEAIGTAVRAMRAFARPHATFQQWWRQLAPLLSQQAQLDYSYVDPSNIPAHEVTGPGRLADEPSAEPSAEAVPDAVSVAVPTDVGTYVVLLTRGRTDAPWRVSRLTPPNGLD